MSTQSDPLIVRSERAPARLYYAQGVLLDAADFYDEQNYHRGRLARALQYLFGTGTVAGLRVDYDAETDEVRVQPGLALDPLGRLIEVSRPRCLRLREWFAAQRDEDKAAGWIRDGELSFLIADVFVRFAVCERGKTPAFAAGPFDALDAVQPSRLEDACELGLVIREEAGLNRQLADIPIPNARAMYLSLPDEPEERLRKIEDLVLSAWRDGTTDWQDELPPRLIEHLPPRVAPLPPDPEAVDGQTVDHTAVGRDSTAVLLARLQVGVDSTAVVPKFLSFTASASNPDNRLRRFIYNSGFLTRPANRPTP